jgi:hypothetical protein
LEAAVAVVFIDADGARLCVCEKIGLALGPV